MSRRNVDRLLPDALADLGDAPYPDYIEQVLTTTARRRQRPAWSFPWRWFPMIVTVQRVPTAVPWRPVVVVGLLATFLAASVGMFLAAQPRPAPWFGPATNGRIAFDDGGAIMVFDPETRESRVLAGDADGWVDPRYSPDGRWLLMSRASAGEWVEFAVMPAEGGPIRIVTPEPVRYPESVDFSPDNRSLILDLPVDIVAAPRPGQLVRSVVIIDIESGDQRVLDLGEKVRGPTAIPPDGRSLLATAGGRGAERYVIIDVASGTMRTLLEPQPGRILLGPPRISPDGRWLAYTDWSEEAEHGWLHVRSMDASGADRIVGEVDGVDWYHVPIWSPDGRTLAVELITFGEHGDTPRLGLVDVENGVGREVDVDLYHGVSKEWSPDSTTLLISPSIGITAQRQLLVDARTLQVSTPPWTSTSYPAWQRLP